MLLTGHTGNRLNEHKQILIRVSSVIEKLVRRKTGLCGVLVLGACYLSGCNGGDTPGSVHSEGDRYAIDTRITDVAISSEGEKLFRLRCGTCHSTDPDRPSVIGPHLAGIFGRSAGSVAGFAYSEALRAYGKNWTPESLDSFLEKPAELIPGNRMALGGIRNAEQRRLIIEYLEIPR